jgi:hypothetical protein
MINALQRAPKLTATMALFILALATPVFSQAPTDAQRSAIRSECRADYQAKCASVPPGGMESLQCLQKNMSSLSPGCQGAVRAVEAPAAPKAESAPPTTTAKPNAEPTAAAPAAPKATAGTATKKPSSAQIAAIRSSCRSDYQNVCAGVPTGGAAALNCLEKNKAKVSASCQEAVSAASGSSAMPAAGGAPAAAANANPDAARPNASGPAPAAAPALVLRPMRPCEQLFVLRSACGSDVRTLCGGVQPGGGRIIQCLVTQAAALSPACKDVLAQFAAQ